MYYDIQTKDHQSNNSQSTREILSSVYMKYQVIPNHNNISIPAITHLCSLTVTATSQSVLLSTAINLQLCNILPVLAQPIVTN